MGIKIEYDLKIEQDDDVPVRGNAMASGDDAADKEIEDEILERLDRGDVIAWCHVTVTATVTSGRHTFTGRAGMGACSYEREADLRRDIFEYYSLKEEALADLMASVEASIAKGREAEVLADLLVEESKRLTKKAVAP